MMALNNFKFDDKVCRQSVRVVTTLCMIQYFGSVICSVLDVA